MNTKPIIGIIAFFVVSLSGWGQSDSSGVTFTWNDYHASYLQAKGGSSGPFLVAHLPSNNKYEVADGQAPTTNNADYLALQDRYHRWLGGFRYLALTVYDSMPVEFIVPFLDKGNASRYEYRVIYGKDSTVPWHAITSFTKDSLGFSLLKKGSGDLGNYATGWDQYIIAELREKGASAPLSAVSIYWKSVRPTILNIYTGNELNEVLLQLQGRGYSGLSDAQREKWKAQYAVNALDSSSGLPRALTLQAPVNGIIFYLKDNIKKKEGLEYQLVYDGKIIRDWGANDFDNGLIWLNNLSPGDYALRFRFSGQRQNPTAYLFTIKPAWHQTLLFKIIFSGLIAAFFCFIVVILKLREQRRKLTAEQSRSEKLAFELRAVYAQLNPHFVFNALTSIQSLIGKQHFADANLYLSKFSALMRATLTYGDKEFITVDQEVKILETYLSLEQLRFGFSFTVDIGPDLNPTETEIPFLLLQPLVENAVKHGVASKDGEGLIHVRFEKRGDDLLVQVMDNGAGFAGGREGGGHGLRLVRSRIELLNKLLTGRSIRLLVNVDDEKWGSRIDLLFNHWFL